MMIRSALPLALARTLNEKGAKGTTHVFVLYELFRLEFTAK
jgi:hypothetical protein